MSETSARVGIYGAIDRAIIDQPEARARVAQLLPAYRDPDVRWIDEFEAWAREKSSRSPTRTRAHEGESDFTPFPSLEQALKQLAAEDKPPGRMRARRLFAIAVATRAFPEMRTRGTDLFELARNALAVQGIASFDGAGQLVELLGNEDDEALAARDLDAWWHNLLLMASRRGLIGDPASFGPRPCTGSLVMVGADPVAALKAGFETDLITFEEAIRFLDPENWPHCNDFWCEVALRGPSPTGALHYHEVVSTDCSSAHPTWTISAELDFVFSRGPGQFACAEYQLSPGHPQPGDDVLVDEGSLIVTQTGATLKVFTTKRVKFSHSFSGEALQLIMCALGYASVVEDLVFTCALDKKPGTDLPTHPGTGGKTTPDVPACVTMIKLATDRAAMSVKTCIDEGADAAKASCQKIDDGQYSADALVQDVASMWVRIMREGATALDLGVGNTRVPTAARTRKAAAS